MNSDLSDDASNAEPAADWKRLGAAADEEVNAAIVNDADIKPTEEAFWKDARVVMPRRNDTATTGGWMGPSLRRDDDLLDRCKINDPTRPPH